MKRRPETDRRLQRTLFVVALCVLGLLAQATGAPAASTHPYDAAFAAAFNFVGASCGPTDVATDAAGNVYVACEGNGASSIRKFSSGGAPLNFSASQPYISGNAIIADPDPASAASSFGHQPKIAIDTSPAHPGFIYVAAPANLGSGGSPNLEIFDPSGKWLGSIVTPDNTGELFDVGVDQNGDIYEALKGDYYGHVDKYDRNFHFLSRLVGVYYADADLVAPDATGGVWTRRPDPPNGGYANPPSPGLYYFTAEQFSTQTLIAAGQGIGAKPSSFAAPLVTSDFTNFTVDLRSNDLYLDRGDHIEPYSHGTEADPPYQNGPSFGAGKLSGSTAVAVDGQGNVYATSSGDKVVKFDAGGVLPEIHTDVPLQADIGHSTATLRGHISLAGGGNITACQLQWGITATPPYPSTASCTPDPSGSNFTQDTDVHADISGLSIGTTYHFRFVASNANGQNVGADRTVSPVSVIQLDTGAASSITKHDAILNGSFNPESESVSYHFEYGLDSTYGQQTPIAFAGPNTGSIPVSADASSLQSGRTYHFHLVASNSLGTTVGPDRTFRTASVPEISGVVAKNLTATSADIFAKINPVGYDTTYHFEYGTSSSYGRSNPPADLPIGNGTEPVEVRAHLDDLQPGAVYHFRVIATSQWGSNSSDDGTFNFFPPLCPNSHVRQVTRAEYLPDCRAYEIVSPGDAGGAGFFPSDEVLDFGSAFNLYKRFALTQWPQNTGLAESPSRFAYYGGLAAVPGTNPPNSLIDQYVATRTNVGWVTTFPGIRGDQAIYTGRKVCSLSLSRCLDHEVSPSDLRTSISAPYLYDVSGQELGRLPTNEADVGGQNFTGDQHPSGDLTHFIFSSNDVAFAQGGVLGAPGSVYDNDVAKGTETIVSRLPGGADIPQGSGTSEEYLRIPGVSSDGSHILISTAAPGNKVHLFMSIDDAVVFDISRGAGVDYVAMTRDGSQVVFATSERLLSGQDHDSSIDLYRWNAADDTLTLLSQGNGNGDSDGCSATWTTSCDVQPISPERAHNPNFPDVSSIPGLDDLIASSTGDAYFYSPENLDSNNPGVPNQKNLYVYRNGAVHLVATLDPDTEVDRMQISPDGSHAALLTTSRLTGYDNHGFRELYTYDADTGVVRCASCNVSGAAPTADVAASQGGPFMSNDGRAFFATPDALVPQDTDGVVDVYEFVDNRPQLISSGTASRDVPSGTVANYFFAAHQVGLESVSANGTDVYFTTFDTLVPQDHNGPFLKVYDARTNGGFEIAEETQPCAAADECHGVGSAEPVSPGVATGQDFGHQRHHRRHRRRYHRHHRRKARLFMDFGAQPRG